MAAWRVPLVPQQVGKEKGGETHRAKRGYDRTSTCSRLLAAGELSLVLLQSLPKTGTLVVVEDDPVLGPRTTSWGTLTVQARSCFLGIESSSHPCFDRGPSVNNILDNIG